MLDQAPHERTIIEQCIVRRCRLPDAIADAPQLLPGLAIYMGAFFDLQTCRPMHPHPKGFRLGPIPWTAIYDWCCAHGLVDDIDDVVFHVCRLDGLWMERNGGGGEAGGPGQGDGGAGG